jgi:hypothetical protein
MSATVAPRPALRPEELAAQLKQPFTFDSLVRAAERQHVRVADLMAWLRDAERRSIVQDTGERRGSSNALRGSRLYRLS